MLHPSPRRRRLKRDAAWTDAVRQPAGSRTFPRTRLSPCTSEPTLGVLRLWRVSLRQVEGSVVRPRHVGRVRVRNRHFFTHRGVELQGAETGNI